MQVIGLSRWVLFVPRISDDALVPAHTADAHHTFELLHTWLGKALGETIGYALTATFTVLVVIGGHPRDRPALDDGRRLCLGRPDRHRRPHPARSSTPRA